MLPARLVSLFGSLYDSDLVYQRECWKLCGDAHCCSFARHKARFRLIAHGGAQDLPLLPGEFEFLQSRDWDSQFSPFERRLNLYDFGSGSVRVDTVSSHRPGCACDHDTRTVVCRLYPLLPVFDLDGHLRTTEPLGVYEELEQLDGLAPACQLSALPFDQLNVFLRICELLAQSPLLLFHLAAYRAIKQHVFDHLRRRRAETGRSGFALFEGGYLRSRLIDHPALRSELATIKAAFDARYGARLSEEMAALQAPAEAPAPEAS